MYLHEILINGLTLIGLAVGCVFFFRAVRQESKKQFLLGLTVCCGSLLFYSIDTCIMLYQCPIKWLWHTAFFLTALIYGLFRGAVRALYIEK